MPTLQFKGRSTIWNHHLSVPYHALEEVRKLDYEPARGEGNLIVEGDNLLALKALLPQYAAKVKCIYIDPPYNTGNEGWAYNDKVNSPMIKDWLGRTVDKDDLTRHDKWLCMMVPRLKLLRELLREDGVIFISIDDNEVSNLRAIMDEIFGEENFVAGLVWSGGRKNDSKLISVSHEYIICYVRDISLYKENKVLWREKKRGLSEIYGKYEQLKTKWKNDHKTITNQLKEWFNNLPDSHSAKAHKHYSNVDERGIYFPADLSWPGGGGPKYEVLHPTTKKPVKIPQRGWTFSDPKTMQEQINKGRIHFGEDETSVPCRKSYLPDHETQVPYSVIYKDGRGATKRLRDLLNNNIFNHPKDENVLRDIFNFTTDKNDIILDSFSGSGTAMHAVMALNKEDGGNRKCIMVQMTEATEKEPKKNICRDITRERVKRAIEKYEFESGFKYLRVGASMDAEDMLAGQLPSYEQLAKYVFYLATGTYLETPTLDRRIHYVGANSSSAVYLIYEPDIDKLTQMALMLDIAEEIIAHNKKRKLIYAPACFLDEEYMEEQQIDFVSVPYNLFERKAV